ncbi:hypothetical protein TcBrA4_0069370 [Trypanosoma cruzi]|nr:hypothetical protein TcBrA4_0069370 [Trypanosoma cruzi]
MSKAPKKRGLSIEEKVSRVEEWFISHPTPYTLKDLLLVLPKSTGVIPQSIEECLELLVSENRICQKKIGVHILFWRFPKTAAQQLAATFNATGGGGASVVSRYMNLSLPQMQKELNALREEEAEARRRIQEVRAGIGDDASVRHDTMKMRQLQEEVKALRVELEKAAVFDPVMVEGESHHKSGAGVCQQVDGQRVPFGAPHLATNGVDSKGAAHAAATARRC